LKIPDEKNVHGDSNVDGWRDIFDSTADAVFVVGSDYFIERANNAFLKLTRQESRNIVGRKCFEVIHATDSPPSWCPHTECLGNLTPVAKTIFEPHLGLNLFISLSPLKNNKDRRPSCIHVVRDVTELAREDRESLKRTGEWLKRTMKKIVTDVHRANEECESATGALPRIDMTDRLFFETRMVFDRGAALLRKIVGSLTFANKEICYRMSLRLHTYTKKLAMLSRELQELESKLQASDKDAAQNIRALMRAVIEASRYVHRLARRLCPEILKVQDLTEAVEKECRSSSAVIGREVTFECGEAPQPVPGITLVGFVSILAETLENAGKSDGSAITVNLGWSTNLLRLSIAGKGIDYHPGFDGPGIGLSAIREWARVLKGEVSVAMHRAGNRLTFRAPLLVGKHRVRVRLSERQRQVLSLLAEGYLTKQIGAVLNISAKTVEFHKRRMMKDLGLKTVVELVRFAIKNRLVAP
jgi:PAS domain S-box-containing protein